MRMLQICERAVGLLAGCGEKKGKVGPTLNMPCLNCHAALLGQEFPAGRDLLELLLTLRCAHAQRVIVVGLCVCLFLLFLGNKVNRGQW
jgi:hypothetical protein